jgi:diamine N-acetyltransferase
VAGAGGVLSAAGTLAPAGRPGHSAPVLVYRPATPADGPLLDAMARAVWLETFGHSAPAADIAAYVAGAYGPAGKLLRHLADPAYAFYLAVEDGAVAGYAKIGPTFFVDEVPTAGAAHLHQIYVAAPWRGRGVAQALMAWSEERARAGGATRLLLTVWEENARALAFYRRRGFVHVGDYAFQTGGQVDRDLILERAL